MKLDDVADGASLHEFVGDAPAVLGMALVAHLRDHLLILGIGLG